MEPNPKGQVASRETLTGEQLQEELKEEAKRTASGWKPGPMPVGTWNWGGIVLAGDSPSSFRLADFRGDHVIDYEGNRIEAKDVVWYNNDLTIPPQAEE